MAQSVWREWREGTGDVLESLLNVTIIVFMVGNLLEVGLRLNVAEALAALRNARFVVLSLLWCIALGPALAVLLWLYRSEIASAVGTCAIASQILCYVLLGFGLAYDQEAPMALGVCTRDVGPALATLMGVADAPQVAVTMCILAIFLGAILSGVAAAAIMKGFCAPAVPSHT